jgi:trans-aconitate methyltransferase
MQITPDTAENVTQQEERFTVLHDDGREEVMRVHEYDRVYAVPGLYELVVQDELQCDSPRMLTESLAAAVTATGGSMADLRILDLGAGNGVLGETLRDGGVTHSLVGLDPSTQAESAAERDRPGLYERYLTCTLGEAPVADLVAEHGLNCLVAAGALGMGHISREEIETAWTAFGPGAWLAVTIHESVLGPDGGEIGEFFAALRAGEMDTRVDTVERFRHRLQMAGGEIYYDVVVAQREGERSHV